MKFSVVLALVAAATVVSAETNAQRMARGLAPNAPGKRATPASGEFCGHIHRSLLIIPFRWPS